MLPNRQTKTALWCCVWPSVPLLADAATPFNGSGFAFNRGTGKRGPVGSVAMVMVCVEGPGGLEPPPPACAGALP